MKNRVFDLLGGLEDQEVADFGRYLRKVDAGGKVTELFRLLRKHHPAYDLSDRRMQGIFFSLFEEKSRKKKNLLNLFSALAGHLKDYFFLSEMGEDPALEQMLLARAYSKRGIPRMVKSSRKKIQHILSEEAENKLEIFSSYRQMLFEYLDYFFLSENGDLKQKRAALSNTRRYAGLFYGDLLAKVRCEQQNRENIFSEESKEDAFPQGGFPTTELGQLYELARLMLKEQDLNRFADLKKAVEEQRHFGREERAVLLGYLINFAARQLKKDTDGFLLPTFKLFQMGMRENLLLQHGAMSGLAFTNILNVAYRFRDFTWIDGFYEKYASKVSGDLDPATDLLIKAQAYFEHGAYAKVVDLLQEARFGNANQTLRAKTMVIMSSYEVGLDGLFNRLDAFRKQVANDNVIHPDIKLASSNFIRLVDGLAKARKSKAVLQKELDTCTFIHHKLWLQEKIDAYRDR